MAMRIQQPTGRLTAQVGELGVRVGGHLAVSMLHQIIQMYTYNRHHADNTINISTDITPPHHNRFTALFFQDHPGEPVPEQNFWTLWCMGRLTEADTPTIQLGATPSGLTTAHLHHPPIFFTGQMPFLPPNQQCQSTEGRSTQGR